MWIISEFSAVSTNGNRIICPQIPYQRSLSPTQPAGRYCRPPMWDILAIRSIAGSGGGCTNQEKMLGDDPTSKNFSGPFEPTNQLIPN